jgi:hypothetical protein
MSGRLLNLLRRILAAGVLLLVPLPAALGLAPEEPEVDDPESMVRGMQIPDPLGERADEGDWNAPNLEWPFGIPRWLEEPTGGRNLVQRFSRGAPRDIDSNAQSQER